MIAFLSNPYAFDAFAVVGLATLGWIYWRQGPSYHNYRKDAVTCWVLSGLLLVFLVCLEAFTMGLEMGLEMRP